MVPFLITFRESLEAGIIVGILFAILRAFNALSKKDFIWAGIILGVVCSLLFAWMFNVLFGGFSGASEKIYEGVLMLLACGLITHMVFWMKSQGKHIKKDMTKKVENVLETNTLLTLTFISFFAVVREGLETIIFLNAINVQSGGTMSLLSGLFGIVAAVTLSYIIYTSSGKVKTKLFFQISGALLLLIASGLLAHGIVELQGANLLPIIQKPVYDLSAILSESEGIGLYLKSLLGYDANPSLIAIVAYALFLAGTFYWYFRKPRKD